MARPPDARDWTRRSQLSFGLALVCGLFLLETAVAHRTTPHPASPLIWTVLGLLALAGVASGLWCAARAAQARRLKK